jgi:hypothetical protein
VHNRGQFAGVRLVSVSVLARYPHLRSVLIERAGTSVRDMCLVSYRGAFRPDQVDRPAGQLPPGGVGHFAIVAVSVPRDVVLATLLFQHEPVRFRHYEFGHFR